MKKKRLINPEKAKIVSTLIILILVIFVVMFLSTVLINSIKKQTEKLYVSDMQTIVEGYGKIISARAELYTTSIKSLYEEEFFVTATDKQIYNYLEKTKDQVHPDFYRYFYVNRNFLLHDADGVEEQLENPEPLNKVFFENQDFVISDPIKNLENPGQSEFWYEKAVKDKDGNVKGALVGAIKLEHLINFVEQIKLEQDHYLSILDSKGYFIVHTDPVWIFKTFRPENPDFSFLSTEHIAKRDSEYIEILDVNNEQISLITQRIPVLDWTLTLKIPRNHFDKLYQKHLHKFFLIIVVALVTIVILMGIEMIIMNVFQKKQLLATLYDPLTHLWTRAHFEHEATKVLKHNSNAKFMLIEGDIRGFKFINQNYGEEAADNLIKYFAEQLQGIAVRLNAIVGRGFADHFYFFVKVSSIHNAMNVFKEENVKLSEEIKAYDIPFFPKFGIAFFSGKGKNQLSTIPELIGQASFAKSTIKDNMLTQYSIYNSRLLEKINKERYIENNMETALEKGEFFVMYQPKIELISDKVVGAEALVRWNSPNLGIVMPDEFIPLFERNGFIKKLDYYVYDRVFAFLQKQIDAGKPVVPISVNMSRSHSKPEKFMHDFMTLFRKYNIKPSLVEVEILERSFMSGNTLKEFTELLHKEGFTVAMDDFGSGESSLNMLTQIPVDVLKFDRTFLVSSTTQSGTIDSTSANFIEKLIELSKNLKKQTIFEGVETQAQIDFLKSIDCDQVQGYFFSKPLSEHDFIDFIDKV